MAYIHTYVKIAIHAGYVPYVFVKVNMGETFSDTDYASLIFFIIKTIAK